MPTAFSLIKTAKFTTARRVRRLLAGRDCSTRRICQSGTRARPCRSFMRGLNQSPQLNPSPTGASLSRHPRKARRVLSRLLTRAPRTQAVLPQSNHCARRALKCRICPSCRRGITLGRRRWRWRRGQFRRSLWGTWTKVSSTLGAKCWETFNAVRTPELSLRVKVVKLRAISTASTNAAGLFWPRGWSVHKLTFLKRLNLFLQRNNQFLKHNLSRTRSHRHRLSAPAAAGMVRSDPVEQWLERAIKATQADPTKLMEGVTGAPVWMTKALANGALRVVRAAYRAGKSAGASHRGRCRMAALRSGQEFQRGRRPQVAFRRGRKRTGWTANRRRTFRHG